MMFSSRIVLILLCLVVNFMVQSAWGSDDEVDPGQTTFRDNYSSDQNERIDPYTGELSLVYTDLKLPGNGGLDLVINRTYNSSRPRHIEKTLLGIGWDIHFGRLLKQNSSNNVIIEFQDGTTNKAVKETLDVSPIFVTKDFWKVDTSTTSPTLYLPDGTEIIFGRGGTSAYDYWYYATEIRKNNKFIQIYYFNTVGDHRIDYVVDSVGRTINFEYTTISNIYRLTSITCPGQPGLTIVYEYPPEDGSVWDSTINKVVLPEGSGSLDYTYASFPFPAGTFCLLKTINTQFNGIITYTYDDFHRNGHNQYSVSEKRVSGPRLASGIWTYDYGTEYTGGWVLEPVDEDYTKITDLCGRITVYHFYGYTDAYDADCYKYGMIKRQFVQDKTTGNIEYAVFNTWDKLVDPISPNSYGISSTCTDAKTYVPVLAKQQVYHGGSVRYSNDFDFYVLDELNIYTTEYNSYDQYGNPESVKEIGGNYNGTTQRNTTSTYWSSPTQYIVKDKPATIRITGDSIFPGSFIVQKNYDDFGNLLTDNQYGVITTYGYTGGNLTSKTEPSNNVTNRITNYTWENGAIKTIENPIYTVDRVINWDGTVQTETNGRGYTTSYEYYADMRLKKIIPPVANPTTFNYVYDSTDPNAPYKSETRGGFSTWTYFDGLGREVKTLDSLGITTDTTYNACGLKSSTSSSIGDKTDFDTLGRVTFITHKDTTKINYAYPDDTHLVITDEKDYTTHQYLNAFGNPDEKYLVRVVDASGKAATYTYNILGSLTVASREGITQSYTYNTTTNLLARETSPEGGTVTYTRYADGTIKTRSDVLGVKTYLYDTLGRLKSISSGGLTQGFGYDKADNMTSVTSPNGSITIGYDEINRPVSKQTKTRGRSGTLLYGYDGNDNIEDITYPSGSIVNYVYNSLNQVARVYGFGGEINNIKYYTSESEPKRGLLKQYTFLNGHTTLLEYNSRRMLTRSSAAPALKIELQYNDPRGNMTAFINNLDTKKNKVFGYDSLNRLKNFNCPSSWGNGTYAYYPSGNRSQKIVGTATTTYTYTSNRLTGESSGRGRTFSYNLNGDMKSMTAGGVSYTYEYDWFHNMTKYLKNSVEVAKYGYDGNGLRLFKDTAAGTVIYHNGLDGNVLSEMSEQGKGLADYVYLNGKLIARAGDQRRVSIAPWLHLLLNGAN